jgi:hypothetical protein
MRQRLGLAAAAPGDPELLLLDEPANGLDAAGVHWLRGFLRQFADGGRTVLLSSHILAEVAQTVDQVPDHRPRPADRNRATERAGQSRPRADEWIHDPSRPVPFIIDASSAQIGGPDDDAGVEMRGDVLVYFRLEVKVVMWDAAQRFLPGHRIRLEIVSSAHPKFATNLGTGGHEAVDTAGVIARATSCTTTHRARRGWYSGSCRAGRFEPRPSGRRGT